MKNDRAKILIIVEGEKTDIKLMHHIISMYGIDKKHEIVSYNTNIYALYNSMFKDNEPEYYDILQVLKERNKCNDKSRILDYEYSDIILVFDFDPQDPQYDKKKILSMQKYFKESSDMGKLYINYPMVEAFYHMKSIPDRAYIERIATKEELIEKKYKKRVQQETIGCDYRKFAVDKEQCSLVIKQNLEKAYKITKQHYDKNEYSWQLLDEVLSVQVNIYENNSWVYVLCTCIFYILDYNPDFIG